MKDRRIIVRGRPRRNIHEDLLMEAVLLIAAQQLEKPKRKKR